MAREEEKGGEGRDLLLRRRGRGEERGKLFPGAAGGWTPPGSVQVSRPQLHAAAHSRQPYTVYTGRVYSGRLNASVQSTSVSSVRLSFLYASTRPVDEERRHYFFRVVRLSLCACRKLNASVPCQSVPCRSVRF